jgi:hypothetical protein
MYLNDLEQFLNDRNVNGLASSTEDFESELDVYLKLSKSTNVTNNFFFFNFNNSKKAYRTKINCRITLSETTLVFIQYRIFSEKHLIYLKLFNCIFDSVIIPESWLTGNVKPIYKNKGNHLDPKYFRSITILSCFGILFTAVLMTRLNAFSGN